VFKTSRMEIFLINEIIFIPKNKRRFLIKFLLIQPDQETEMLPYMYLIIQGMYIL